MNVSHDSVAPSKPAKENPALKVEKKSKKPPQTIFGNADEKPKEKAEKVSVSINTSANMTFKQKVKQYRFLFE